MIFKRTGKSICFIIILCMLLSGMYPSKGRVDSFFASPNSCSSPISAITNTTLTSPGSNVVTKQAYTRETIMQQETILAPQQTVRRISMRLILRGLYAFPIDSNSLQLFFNPSVSVSHHIPDGFISNTIIVTYIHSQDGEKV